MKIQMLDNVMSVVNVSKVLAAILVSGSITTGSIWCVGFAAAVEPHEAKKHQPRREVTLATGLKVFPPKIELVYGDDAQRIGVQIVNSDGSTQDVTREVTWLEAEGIMMDATSVSPASEPMEKSGRLRGTWRNEAFEIPYQLFGNGLHRKLSFRNDILPVLTKTGCNSGKCHGAASGKDGFRLSLYGFDPAGDYFRITREVSGRRINLSSPEHCLLINKAIGEVPHTGGNPIEVGDPNYSKLVRWLANGAKADVSATPVPVGIEVFPRRAVLSQPGKIQQMIVMARYDDGSTRDVTEQAVFISNNDGAGNSICTCQV